MSKRQSVILSVVLEGRSQADTAKLYEVSEATVSRWVARYRSDGVTAFEPRSRRPKRSPSRLADVVIKQVLNLRAELTTQGLDAGAATIAWHLKDRHDTTVSISTIRRHLISAGLVTPEPKKRPKSSYIRFQADLPNETWQTDMTHWRLANGNDAEILSWLDDHSRYALSVTAHNRVNTTIVVDQFDKTAGQHSHPASVLSDNGLYYTARFARGGASGPNRFEQHLTNLGIHQKHSRPNHPTTCGKVERFQQTLKKWLRAQTPAATITALQVLLERFIHTYNTDRPHRALGTTPTTAYNRLPKTGPTGTKPQLRIRHDRVDKTGSVTLRYHSHLHHIGIGRPHAGTQITLLIADRDIRIINTQTGELLRHLTLDPTRDYQPQKPKNLNP
ncbi:MAG: IS481 family transposase [Gemmatimonadales bacterium]|nr:IS481 family transposase [Gemmatimonadales bacterium]MBT7690977.1 IS481 family transposase [Gemmatimonadales bacterium]